MNLWFIKDLFEYAYQKQISVSPSILKGPDYLALDVIPDQLKSLALEKINQIKEYIDINLYTHLINIVTNNVNQCLIQHSIAHILLLDNKRNEKLFNLLPFHQIAKELLLKNHEYG